MEIPERPQLPSPEVDYVDSSNFLLYLAGLENYSSNPRISSYLDLSWGTDIFTKLYQEGRQDFVHSAEERLRFDAIKTLTPRSPILHIAAQYINRFVRQYKPDTAEKGGVEKSTTLYLDYGAGTIANTEIEEGEYKRVVTNTGLLREISEDGNDRLLPAHTHPGNVLFSPQDYARIIEGLPESNHRLFKATVVLCPDIQVLALPTSQTPIVHPDQIEEFVNKLNIQFDTADEEADKKIKQRAELITSSLVHTVDVDWRKTLAYAKRLNTMKARGRLDPSELEQRLSRRVNKSGKYAHAQGEKYFRIASKLHDRDSKLGQLATVHGTVDCARALNVHLYSSTNMQDFYAFSA